MRLRTRLLAAVTVMLLIALVVGGALVRWRAAESVRVEMRAALVGAVDEAWRALAIRATPPDRAFLVAMAASYDGERHVRALVFDRAGALLAQSRLARSSDDPPAWFTSMIDVGTRTARIPLASSGPPSAALFELRTDPSNEIAEVWRQAIDAFGVVFLLCAGICIAVYAIIGHALRALPSLGGALAAVSEGKYDSRASERGPPEFVALARGFNRMAARLGEYHRGTSQLREQLLTLQEEERAEVARDLHDEVGPYLFAISVDADEIPRLVSAGDAAGLGERAASIKDAAAHIQKHVKAILRQLRSTDALELGLRTAIEGLIAFWRRRDPAIRFDVEITLDRAFADRAVEDVAYRIAQEGISNAIRHGRPTAITIAVVSLPSGEIRVSVTDDGGGLPPTSPRSGIGLAGMAERVAALDGRFSLSGGPGGRGASVVAILPARAVAAAVAEAPQ